MTDRVPPQNLEAEESILGAMLLSPRAIEESAELLTAQDFYRESHGVMFSAAVQMHAEGQPVDAVTFAAKLDTMGKLAAVGGTSRVVELAALVPSTSNVAHYARIVRDQAVRRRLVRAGHSISELGMEGGDIDTTLALAEAELTKATASTQITTAPLTEGFDTFIAELREAYSTGVSMHGELTGYPCIDGLLGGFWPGQLILLAARPGNGKSTLAMNISENLADRGDTVLFGSLEMSRLELQIRSLARAARVDSRLLSTGRLTEEDAKSLPGGIKIVQGRSNLHVEDEGGLTVQKLGARAAKLKRTDDLKLIVVDYIQLMAAPGSERNRSEQIGEISRGLKLLARRLNVPILALSQMNRAIEGRQDKRPVLSDLRESGTLEQDADVVMFLHDDASYDKDKEPDGTVELIVAKNRKGPADTLSLAYVKRYSTFKTIPVHATKEAA